VTTAINTWEITRQNYRVSLAFYGITHCLIYDQRCRFDRYDTIR